MPLYNEAVRLAHNLTTIRSYAITADRSIEIIAIDDGSTDDTWQTLCSLSPEIPELRGLRLTRNFGKEAAISAGLGAARGLATIVIDADLQHPPELIPEMVRLWREERWKIVEAVKTVRGKEPLFNKVAARLFYKIITRLSGYDLNGASDFQLLDHCVIKAWQNLPERNTFFRALTAWLGYRKARIPFTVRDRADGKSRFSLKNLFGLATVAITAFSALPLQIVSVLGVIFLLCACALTLESLWMYFSGRALPGFTTVILLELIVGGVLMISLGVIGTYLGRVYDETKRRPRFIVSDQL